MIVIILIQQSFANCLAQANFLCGVGFRGYLSTISLIEFERRISLIRFEQA
jgi:hypothetical protein